jgi:hypothetical protein
MKIKVKNIHTFFNNKEISHEGYYNWDKLEGELKGGYDEKKPMEVLRLFNGKYILVEGSHRLSLIKKLYGGEYEIEAKKTYMLKILLTYVLFLTLASFWYIFMIIKSIFKKI